MDVLWLWTTTAQKKSAPQGKRVAKKLKSLMDVEGMDVDGGAVGSSETHVLIYDAERRNKMLNRLRKEKVKLASLPKNSQYMAHRVRVVNRALEILEEQNESLNKHEDELASLLSSLSL